MRCLCCNKALSDYESTRRHALTKEFLDLCNECFSSIDETSPIPSLDRPDLLKNEDFPDVDEGIDSFKEL